MTTKKQKYKNNLKEIRDDAILKLEPIVREKGNQAIEVLKEMTNDFITSIFSKKREKVNDNKEKGSVK